MGNVCSESTAGMKHYFGEDAVMYWKEREVVSSMGKSFTAWLCNGSALCFARLQRSIVGHNTRSIVARQPRKDPDESVASIKLKACKVVNVKNVAMIIARPA